MRFGAPVFGDAVFGTIPVFFYKTHISIHRNRSIIRRLEVNDTITDDGARLREGLIHPAHTPPDLWAPIPLIGTHPRKAALSWKQEYSCLSVWISLLNVARLPDSRLLTPGRRRRWSEEETLRIVEESYSAPRRASATARRHGIFNQLDGSIYLAKSGCL